jgi:hypothetical protein
VAFICLTVAFVLDIPGLPVSAAGAPVVSVSAPTQAVSPNTQFTISIAVQPNDAIAGAQFNLSFDPTLVSINNVSEGDLLNQNGANTYFNPGQINNTAGTISGVAGAIITPGQTVSTQGTFAVINMTAGSNKGTSALSLSNVVIADINGKSITASTTNGQVSVDRAPVLTQIGRKTVCVNSLLTFAISATDADSDTLTYSASNLPSGASFNASTCTFSWTPSLGQVGNYANVHFEVTDGMAVASENITVTVNKPTPVFSDLSAPSIVYGTTPTSLGGTLKSGSLIPTGSVSITLNGVIQTAAINGSGNFASSFATASLGTSGSPYTISYVYGGDTNFNTISDTTNTLTVNGIAARVTLGNLNQTYNGTAKNVTATTNPTGLSVSITYNGSATAPTNAGSYNIVATITSPNYSGSATGTLTIAKATPVFSNLRAPSIVYGTTPTSLGGTLKSGSLIPTGNVSITLNGVTQTAAIDGPGNFTCSFATGSLGVSGSPYAISYVYAGDTNFHNASDNTKTLIVIQTYSAWDVNMDGSVNVLDMITVSQHFGESGSAGWISQDVNSDGLISVLDFVLIGQHWTG